MSRTAVISLLQMKVTADKSRNLNRAGDLIARASSNVSAAEGLRIVVLPEFFNAPYDMRRVNEFAEEAGGNTCLFLAEQARQHSIILIGGSIPEIDEQGRFYNTSFIYGPDGSFLGRHRKVHLFDINMPGQIQFRESDFLSAGDQLTVIHSGELCFGVQICFDIRFPEWSRLAVQHGAELLIIPAAFNTTTGPLHWELVLRSRAVDNQLFVAACSPARNPELAYQAWGHSLVADPMGQIVAAADETEQIVNCRLDLGQVAATRDALPILKNRRPDLYEVREPGLFTGEPGQ